MAKKIKMTLYSTLPLSYRERLAIMGKVLGTCDIWGMTMRFNNSIGFKKVSTITETPSGGVVHSAEIPSPDSYCTPEKMLVLAGTFCNEPNEIVSFIADNSDYVHPVSEYSYNTLEMLVRFQEYLYKQLSSVKVKISFLSEDYKQSMEEFTLGYFMTCLAYADNCETEFSGSRFLSKKGKDRILEVIKQVVDYEPVITQYLCETCRSYHPDHPIYTQLDNAKTIEHWDNEVLLHEIKERCGTCCE